MFIGHSLTRLLAPAAMLLAIAWPSDQARAYLVYVLNSGEASVTVIDSQTREEFRRIPVLREPHHLVMTPDGRELMIADAAANEMLWINPDTAEVIRRERISNPYHLGYSPDGKYFVVNSLRRSQVDIYNGADMTLLARLPTPTQPSHMAFSPDSKRVFVTLQGSRGLLAIDLDERKPLWTLDVGPQPAGVIWHNSRLLVGVMGSNYVAVVDPGMSAGTSPGTARVERNIIIGRGSHTVWPSPDGKTIYATSRLDSAITLLDAETLQVKGRWDIPGGPDDIAVAPDGKLWVTLRWTARVAIIDPHTGEYEVLRVGKSPHGILVHPTPTAQPVAAAQQPAAPGPERSGLNPAAQAIPGPTGALPALGLVSGVFAAATPPPAIPSAVLGTGSAPQPQLLVPYAPWWRRLSKP